MNKNRKALLICTVAVLALAIGGIYSVSADNLEEGSDANGWGFFAMRGWGMPFRGMIESLTEEQRNELATEIQELVESKFKEWEIEPPEPLLSEDQRSDLQDGIEQLREDGATPEEIREYIDGKLKEYGVELPRRPEGHCRFQRRGRFMNGLPGGICKRQFFDVTD
jgi:hypothetical protein